ncbi:hypothetical protein EBZ37_10495 [bacterium]|nr:hypothetical protein [bacterium]
MGEVDEEREDGEDEEQVDEDEDVEDDADDEQVEDAEDVEGEVGEEVEEEDDERQARLETEAEEALFLAGSLACFVFAVKRRILAAKPAVAAFFSMTALYCFVIGLTPAIHALMVEPQQKIAEDLKALNPSPTDCIRYAGPLSATLSLALGPKLIHNRCDPTQVRYLIVPEWKVDECPAPEFTRVSQHGHLILCKR